MISIALWSSLCLAFEPRELPPKHPIVVGRTARTAELVVKFTDASGARATGGRVRLGDELDAVVAAHGLSFRPLLSVPEPDLVALRTRAERRSGREQPDLGAMHVVDLAATSPEAMERAANALLALDQVEWVSIAPTEAVPPGDIPPVTPDLTGEQRFLVGPDPGVDFEAAWDLGFHGEGVRFSDVEFGARTSHEELVDVSIELEDGQTPDESYPLAPDWLEHGTAVTGLILSPDNGYGVTGLAPSVEAALFSFVTVEDGYRKTDALALAVAASEAGDVVLLEMQSRATTDTDSYAPVEIEMPVWTISREASDAGVILVAAAGNGAQDLDSSLFDEYRSRGDSGAIIVGSGTPDELHAPRETTTFGERVNVQGWGDFVFTIGSGGGFAQYGGPDDANQYYEHDFGGTSAASAVVAGAAALVSQAIQELGGEPAGPEEVRDILIETGTPQTGSRHIGPLPDLGAAMDLVIARAAPLVFGLEGGEGLEEGQLVSLSVDPFWRSADGGDVVWAWDDGPTGSGDAFERSFPDDGAYTVQLTLEDATGHERPYGFEVQVANVAPTIEDVVTADLGRRELELEAIVTDPGDDTVDVSWAFADGTVLTGAIVEHRFDEVGPHDVTVTATDEDGGETVRIVTIDVEKGCGCDGVGAAWGLPALVAMFGIRRRRPPGR